MEQLSPQNEAFIERIVAGGVFPSKSAAIDAAVTALREQNERIPFVPDEHMDAVEEGLRQANAGLSRPITADDWANLRQFVRDVATGKH